MCGSVLWRAELCVGCWSCAHTDPLFSINAAAISLRQLFPRVARWNWFLQFIVIIFSPFGFCFRRNENCCVYNCLPKMVRLTYSLPANTKAKLCVFAFLFVIHNRHLFHWVAVQSIHIKYSTYAIHAHQPRHTHTHIVMRKEMGKMSDTMKPNQFPSMAWYSQSLRFILSWSNGAFKSHLQQRKHTKIRPPIFLLFGEMVLMVKWSFCLSRMAYRYTEYANTIAQVNYECACVCVR